MVDTGNHILELVCISRLLVSVYGEFSFGCLVTNLVIGVALNYEFIENHHFYFYPPIQTSFPVATMQIYSNVSNFLVTLERSL